MEHSFNIPPELQRKLANLEKHLLGFNEVAIGFSGGVDSTFLAAVCARCMPERTVLIHLDTPFIGTPEREMFARGVEQLGLPIVEIGTDPLSCDTVSSNPPDRCYHCKRLLFTRLVDEACARGCTAILDGSNADDASDFRPGMQALRELMVHSPLMDCGWHKDEERVVLRAWGFDVWALPAGACLATRIASGEPITLGKLEVIRACEDRVREEGVQQVRARLRGGAISIHVDRYEMPLISTDDEGALLPRLLRDLQKLSGVEVSPFVQPYRHGETSVRTA